MATAFEEAHADQIAGCLTTVDRLIIHGHLTLLWRPGAFPTFLLRQGIRFSDFARYVWKITDTVKKHAKRIAKEAGRPFIYQAEVVRGKDDLARAIAKRDGITKGLVCVLSTLEMAKSFAFINGRIIPHRRKCLHFYFYLIDAELGFMHVRLQSWFPFQIQIYLNGREWLARQLDKRGIGARFPKWNPVAEHDCQIFRAVLAGEHAISGFRNRDLQARLYRIPAAAPDEAKRRCSRVCRIIGKLRGHGLIAKVPGSRLYRVTSRGHRVMSAALRFRHLDFPKTIAA